MTNEESLTRKSPSEFVFSLILLAISIVILVSGSQSKVDEVETINSRSLPVILSSFVVFFSVIRSIQTYPGFEKLKFTEIVDTEMAMRVVVPLTAIMIGYVELVHISGYPVATVVVMLAVLWIYHVRHWKQALLISLFASALSYIAFAKLLGMYFPAGWIWKYVPSLF